MSCHRINYRPKLYRGRSLHDCNVRLPSDARVRRDYCPNRTVKNSDSVFCSRLSRHSLFFSPSHTYELILYCEDHNPSATLAVTRICSSSSLVEAIVGGKCVAYSSRLIPLHGNAVKTSLLPYYYYYNYCYCCCCC